MTAAPTAANERVGGSEDSGLDLRAGFDRLRFVMTPEAAGLELNLPVGFC